MAEQDRLEAFIQGDRFTELLPRLYGDGFDAQKQASRFMRLLSAHHGTSSTGVNAQTGLFSTAGRSELAGNHPDHNLGKVIAATINLDTIAVATPVSEPVAILVSEGFPPVTVDLRDTSFRKEEKGTTEALVRGIAAGFLERGLKIGGFVANTSTSVLKGSGLSSSAAIEVLVATLFNNLYNRDILEPIDLAILGKFAENNYFGKPSGLMDQIACGQGGVVGIDFAHPEHPSITPISCNFRELGYDLLVVDTGGRSVR